MKTSGVDLFCPETGFMHFRDEQVAPKLNHEVQITMDNHELFLHTLRDALRVEQMWPLKLAREGYDGVQHGVHRTSTMCLKGKLAGMQKYRWRCIMAGAIGTGNRLFRAKRLESPLCELCGTGAVETLEHLADVCPALDHIRYRELLPTSWHTLPDALRLRGIVTENIVNTPGGRDFQQQDWKNKLACLVQYTLLDMVAYRLEHMPQLAPQPRWAPPPRAGQA